MEALRIVQKMVWGPWLLVLVNKGSNISHVFSTMDTSTYDALSLFRCAFTPVSCMLPTTSIPSRWACSP